MAKGTGTGMRQPHNGKRGAAPLIVTRASGGHNTSLALRVDHELALDERAGELGISRSEVVREILDQWLTLGRPPIERGYMAGWRAGYREFMKRVSAIGADMTAELDNGEVDLGGLDEG